MLIKPTQECISMEFGSKKIYINTKREEEEIYKDEVNDGIASCAEEQAIIWADASKDDENIHSKAFVEELLRMTKKCQEAKAGKQRAGGLGCKSRLQPRYQKGNQQKFDRVVDQRIKNDFQQFVLEMKGLEQ
jgi:hypothetical protein